MRWQVNTGSGGNPVTTKPAARVPLIVSDRQLQQSHGARITAPVELNDLFPTLCARAGIPIPEGLDGDDLTNLMSGNTESWRNTAITEYWAKPDHGSNAYAPNAAL